MEGISHRFCRQVHRSDGYSYQSGVRPGRTTPPRRFRRNAPFLRLKHGGGMARFGETHIPTSVVALPHGSSQGLRTRPWCRTLSDQGGHLASSTRAFTWSYARCRAPRYKMRVRRAVLPAVCRSMQTAGRNESVRAGLRDGQGRDLLPGCPPSCERNRYLAPAVGIKSLTNITRWVKGGRHDAVSWPHHLLRGPGARLSLVSSPPAH